MPRSENPHRLRFDEWRKLRERLNRKRGKKPSKGGGSEAVTVEPDRPIQGAGGAAAPLEFDEG